LNHLAGASVALGDPRAALGYYIRATDAEPENALTHFSAANVACLFRHDLGRTEEECFRLALKHFAEAHRLSPKNPEFARGYAETFYMLPRPDWETALNVWKNYLNIVSEKNFALLNLARVHMKLGDAENARACLSQVTGKGNEALKKRLADRIEAELSPAKMPVSPEIEKTSKPVIDGDPVRP
jgi:FimV-like protein